jgi:hypothetical protein
MVNRKSKPSRQPHVVLGVDARHERLESSADSYNGKQPQNDNNKPRGAEPSILSRSEIPNSASGTAQASGTVQFLDRSNESSRLYVSFGPSGGATRALLSFEIGHIRSDRQLFQLLQAAYRSGSAWNRLFSVFSLREVRFAKVRLSRLTLE